MQACTNHRPANDSKHGNIAAAVLVVHGKRGAVAARLVDAKGVWCLDARNVVRFGLAGDGRLIDNLGTSTAARKVELYNGRAPISMQRKGRSVMSVSSDGLPTAFLII